MRRKQTAAFIVLLLLSSLAFVSQTRPQSPVDSTNPTDAGGALLLQQMSMRTEYQISMSQYMARMSFSRTHLGILRF